MVAAWNGLAIAALADAGEILGRQDWVDAAVECADLIPTSTPNGRGKASCGWCVSRVIAGRVERRGCSGGLRDVAEGCSSLRRDR